MRSISDRPSRWARLGQPWDLIVIGGGITGAAVLREAARAGLRAALVEQRDFAWGSSSRSSKLVHGGLRYLKQAQIGLTRESVGERERLLREAPGLVEPLGFLLPTYAGERPGRWLYAAGLALYDLLGRRWDHRYEPPEALLRLAPPLDPAGLRGGYRYGDAQTDDARLVLRLLDEAQDQGALALNYVAAEELLREGRRVVGVRVRDQAGGQRAELRAPVVVNATGAWADRLRGQIGRAPQMRPLRGSHLVFPAWRLPLAQAVTFPHPLDRRPVFLLPWQGVTLVGTTDVDHAAPLDDEPAISPQEVAYLMAAVSARFPALELTLDDLCATFAGVRPVVGSGQADPSREPRDRVVWAEEGLLTVTGGKLTTFRPTALDALEAARPLLPDLPALERAAPMFEHLPDDLPAAAGLDAGQRARLLGRYGRRAAGLLGAAGPGELAPVAGTPTLWAELRWAARAEAVQHLDDLLLRRTRLGLLLPEGGAALLADIRGVCQAELGWDDARWEHEARRYCALWQRCYGLPERASIPAWQPVPAAPPEPAPRRLGGWGRTALRLALAGGLSGLGLAALLFRRHARQTAI